MVTGEGYGYKISVCMDGGCELGLLMVYVIGVLFV